MIVDILRHLIVGHLGIGCLFGIVAEFLDGTAGKHETLRDMLEEVAFTVLAWPWILWAIFTRAGR